MCIRDSLYYLPMLFISILSVFVSLSLGKPDNFRLPKWTKFLYIPTAALLMLVLTNDLHQLVFVFPKDAVIWGNDYHYAFGYFLVIGYIVVCIITTLITMLIKCRIPHRRNVLMLPIIPMALAVFYSVLYIFRVSWLRTIAGDVTVVFCLLIMAAMESCIRCGLIQSNIGYCLCDSSDGRRRSGGVDSGSGNQFHHQFHKGRGAQQLNFRNLKPLWQWNRF